MNTFPVKSALAVAVAGFLGATGAMAQTTTMSPSTVAPSKQSDVKVDERSAPMGTPSKTDSSKEAATPMGGASATGAMSKSSQDKMAMPTRSETADAAWTKLDA